MKKIPILIVSISLVFGLIGIGTQAYFSDVETSGGNTFIAGVWECIITASAGDGGSIDPSGEIPVNKGNNQTFNITPEDGYEIDAVVVDEVDSVKDVLVEEDGSGTYTFINVTENHTIHAIFAPLTWDKSSLVFTWAGTIDATQVCATVKNGDDSGAMQGEVDWELHYVESGQAPGPQNDKEESIIARGKIPALVQSGSYNICWPESGQVGPGIYKFKAYQRPGYLGTDSFWSDEIDINATYEKTVDEQVTYTITATADENGSISPDVATVEDGGSETFTITPADGYKIADVVVDEVDSVKDVLVEEDGSRTYTFTNVTDNHTIHATFVQQDYAIHATFKTVGTVTYTITATADAGGSIEPSGEILVNKGDNQTFNITPNAGYEIADVSVDGESVDVVSSYEFENVTGDHTIHAIFAEEIPTTYTITATKEGNGSISDEGVTTLNEGESKTYTITPDIGYVIADVVVDGESVDVVSSYEFENVVGDHTIHATFKEDTND